MQSRLEQSKNWDMGKGDEPTSESWNPSSVSWWVMGRPTINLKIHSRRHEPRQQHLDTIRFRNGGATQMTGNNHSLTRSIWWFRPLSRVLFSFFFSRGIWPTKKWSYGTSLFSGHVRPYFSWTLLVDIARLMNYEVRYTQLKSNKVRTRKAQSIIHS